MKNVRMVVVAFLCLLRVPLADASQTAGNDYKVFQAQFKFQDFKPIFVTHEIQASGPPLKGSSLKFLPGNWPEGEPGSPYVRYEPVMAFHFDQNHDAYLILGPSPLNGKNVNLLIFDSRGRLMAREVVAGDYGDEGYYTTTFGWIRDLNNDHQLDLLLRVQTTRLSKDSSRKEYATDKLSNRIWNGTSFQDGRLKESDRLKLETNQDVGTFRFELIRQWDSDPRAKQAAILTYEEWLRTYPGNSHVAEVKRRIQQLKNVK